MPCHICHLATKKYVETKKNASLALLITCHINPHAFLTQNMRLPHTNHNPQIHIRVSSFKSINAKIKPKINLHNRTLISPN